MIIGTYRGKRFNPFAGGLGESEIGRAHLGANTIIRARKLSDDEPVIIEVGPRGGWRTLDASSAKDISVCYSRARRFILTHAPELLKPEAQND